MRGRNHDGGFTPSYSWTRSGIAIPRSRARAASCRSPLGGREVLDIGARTPASPYVPDLVCPIYAWRARAMPSRTARPGVGQTASSGAKPASPRAPLRADSSKAGRPRALIVLPAHATNRQLKPMGGRTGPPAGTSLSPTRTRSPAMDRVHLLPQAAEGTDPATLQGETGGRQGTRLPRHP